MYGNYMIQTFYNYNIFIVLPVLLKLDLTEFGVPTAEFLFTVFSTHLIPKIISC